jgi:preprotein translocase subunit SecA
MRLFGGDRMQNIMDRVGFTDDTPIEAGLVTRQLEGAQRKVENHNYEIRKSVLEYDDVMNKQREIIYADRRAILASTFPTRDFMLQTLHDKVENAVDRSAPENVHPSEWDLPEILNELELFFPLKGKLTVADLEKIDRAEMKGRLEAIGVAAFEAKEAELSPDLMRVIESQYIMLPTIDRLWVDHLYVMDALKTGIGLRGYGQKDPRVEYEKEAYEIFEDLKTNIADEALKSAFRIVIERQDPGDPGAGYVAFPENSEEPQSAELAAQANGRAPGPSFEPVPDGSLAPQVSRIDPGAAEKLLGPPPGAERAVEMHTNLGNDEPRKPARATLEKKVGRNDPCPCGSGRKYKRCHGAQES